MSKERVLPWQSVQLVGLYEEQYFNAHPDVHIESPLAKGCKQVHGQVTIHVYSHLRSSGTVHLLSIQTYESIGLEGQVESTQTRVWEFSQTTSKFCRGP